MQHVLSRILLCSHVLWGFTSCGVEERNTRTPAPSTHEPISVEFAINHWKIDQPITVDGTIAAIYPDTKFHGIRWTALALQDVWAEDSHLPSPLWVLICSQDCKKAPAIEELEAIDLGNQIRLTGILHQKKNILLPVQSVAILAEDTQPPSRPTNLTAVALEDGIVSLSWEPSLDSAGEFGLSHYIVWRDQVELVHTEATQLEYLDHQVQPATQYTYTVQAVDLNGNVSLASDPVVVETNTLPPLPDGDSQPPSVPLGLVAIANGSDSVILSWEFSYGDLAVAGYQVFRDGVLISETAADSPAYFDLGLTPSTEYSYQVSAFDEAGNRSDRTVPVSVRTTDLATEL